MGNLMGKGVAVNFGQPRVVRKKWKITKIILNVQDFPCVFWMSISTDGRFSTSLLGLDVKITRGLVAGDRETARKLIAHTRSNKQMHMHIVSQQDLAMTLNKSFLFQVRLVSSREEVFKD